eukprot:scaffold98919_cov39-Phaeocystis_antarctica.AAC.1
MPCLPCRWTRPRSTPPSTAHAASSSSGCASCCISSSAEHSHASMTSQAASSSGVTKLPWKRMIAGWSLAVRSSVISLRSSFSHASPLLARRFDSSGSTLMATTLPLCFSAASHTVPKLPEPSCRKIVNIEAGSAEPAALSENMPQAKALGRFFLPQRETLPVRVTEGS